MADINRYCPLCDQPMDDEICPEHRVKTVLMDDFESEEEELLEVGAIVADRYRVERVLGQGGMGTVFLATQLSVERPVALKTLRKNLLNNQTLVKRFYQEARASSHLNHPNIIRIFDFGIDHVTGVPFIAMEHLKGNTLDELIRARTPLSEIAIAETLRQVAKALVEAHSKGVIHRDLKPENIMIRQLADGERLVKVLDFGISKVIGEGTLSSTSLTGDGGILGTPLYISPEQVRGEDLDFRADLYSLGCLLYEMCSGTPPFDAKDAVAVMMKHVTTPAPNLPDQLLNGDAPSSDLRFIYQSLVSKERESRPVNSTVVSYAFKSIIQGRTVPMDQLLSDPSFPMSSDTDIHPVLQKGKEEEVNQLARTTSDHLDHAIDLSARRSPSWATLILLSVLAISSVAFIWSRDDESGGAKAGLSDPPSMVDPGSQSVMSTNIAADVSAVPESPPNVDAGSVASSVQHEDHESPKVVVNPEKPEEPEVTPPLKGWCKPGASANACGPCRDNRDCGNDRSSCWTEQPRVCRQKEAYPSRRNSSRTPTTYQEREKIRCGGFAGKWRGESFDDTGLPMAKMEGKVFVNPGGRCRAKFTIKGKGGNALMEYSVKLTSSGLVLSGRTVTQAGWSLEQYNLRGKPGANRLSGTLKSLDSDPNNRWEGRIKLRRR